MPPSSPPESHLKFFLRPPYLHILVIPVILVIPLVGIFSHHSQPQWSSNSPVAESLPHPPALSPYGTYSPKTTALPLYLASTQDLGQAQQLLRANQPPTSLHTQTFEPKKQAFLRPQALQLCKRTYQ